MPFHCSSHLGFNRMGLGLVSAMIVTLVGGCTPVTIPSPSDSVADPGYGADASVPAAKG